jgi:hypothetical protein
MILKSFHFLVSWILAMYTQVSTRHICPIWGNLRVTSEFYIVSGGRHDDGGKQWKVFVWFSGDILYILARRPWCHDFWPVGRDRKDIIRWLMEEKREKDALFVWLCNLHIPGTTGRRVCHLSGPGPSLFVLWLSQDAYHSFTSIQSAHIIKQLLKVRLTCRTSDTSASLSYS